MKNNRNNHNSKPQSRQSRRKHYQYNSQNKRRFPHRKKRNIVKCCLCNKIISDTSTIINEKNLNKPAHFDCILNQLKKEYKLTPREKIYYLGGGSFGIVQDRGPKSQIRFFIRKRIEYEKRQKKEVEI